MVVRGKGRASMSCVIGNMKRGKIRVCVCGYTHTHMCVGFPSFVEVYLTCNSGEV